MDTLPSDARPDRHAATARQRVAVEPLDAARLAQAKRSFTTRRVDLAVGKTLVTGHVRPRTGDLVLARVARIGQHAKLESPEGRRALMHLGDEILVTFADRYAPDQFESQVPRGLGAAHLVASGGVASLMISRNAGVRRPTDIAPIGLVGDARGVPLNLADFGLEPVAPPEHRPPVVAVVGTSMNSGKTTTSHWLVHTLARAGLKPGATKVTGTGSGGDYWVMKDAGAHMMLDFTDVGLASTFRIDMDTIERKAIELIDHLAVGGSGAIAVEVADGLFQHETARLLQSDAFRSRVDAFIFAAADSMGAIGGYERLRILDLPVVGISGRLTRSPLSVRETVKACEVPVFTLADLADPRIVMPLFGMEAPAEPEAEPADVVPALRAPEKPEPAYEPLARAASDTVASDVSRWRAIPLRPVREMTVADG